MRALGLLLAILACVRPAWGADDAPRVVDVSTARLVRPDGGVVDVDGGGWLSDPAIDAEYAYRRQLEAENAAGRQAAGGDAVKAGTAGLALGIVLGVIFGWTLHR